MIRLLSEIGRFAVVAAAALTVLAGMIEGNVMSRGYEIAAYGAFSISGGGQFTPQEMLGILLGGLVGLVLAGTVLGAIATLYEIRDNLHYLVMQSPGGSAQPVKLASGPTDRPHERREPRIS